MRLHELTHPFVGCERVTGVINNYTFVARNTGAWKLFHRGTTELAASGAAAGLREARAHAIKAAENLAHAARPTN